MKKTVVFDALSIIFLIILFFWIYNLDKSDLGAKKNISSYLGIVSAVLMIIAMQLTKRNLKK